MTSSAHKSESKPVLLFLSHAGEDAQQARELATVLRAAGLEVWLDVEQLQPGHMWQREITTALCEADALVLLVGRSGVTRWVDFEVQIALDRSAKDRAFRFIPVLGPGSDPASLPDFVRLFQWLDMSEISKTNWHTIRGRRRPAGPTACGVLPA